MDMNNNICMNIMQHNSRRGALQGAAAPERKYRNVFAGRLLMLLMLFLLLGWSNGVMAQTKTVNWVIVALDGSRALTIKDQTVTVGANPIDAFPAKYKSPLLRNQDYTFYTDFEGAQSKDAGKQILTIPAELPSNDTIYVGYTVNKEYAKTQGFKSGFGYNIRRVGDNSWGETSYLVSNDYIDNNISNDANIAPKYTDEECAYFTTTNKPNLKAIYSGPASLKQGRFIWRLNMDDPYQITVQTLRDDEKRPYFGRYLTAREKWSGGNGFKDSRLKTWDIIQIDKRIWAFAIVPGNTEGSYKLLVADNMSQVPKEAGLDEQGHGYLNNARSGRPDNATFNNHTGSNLVKVYSDLEITLQTMTGFEYRVTTPLSKTAISAAHWIDLGDDNANKTTELAETLVMPEKLKRKFCTNYTFYSDKEFTHQVTTYQQVLDAGGTVIYVKYDVVDLPFQTSPNLEVANWYRLRITDKNGAAFFGCVNNNKAIIKGADDTYNNTYYFAFQGDPYELVCR